MRLKRNIDIKIKPSDMEAEARRLIDAGQMPSVETLLQVIAETREQYLDQILAARKESNGDDE